jgi:hypothetical protein
MNRAPDVFVSHHLRFCLQGGDEEGVARECAVVENNTLIFRLGKLSPCCVHHALSQLIPHNAFLYAAGPGTEDQNPKTETLNPKPPMPFLILQALELKSAHAQCSASTGVVTPSVSESTLTHTALRKGGKSFLLKMSKTLIISPGGMPTCNCQTFSAPGDGNAKDDSTGVYIWAASVILAKWIASMSAELNGAPSPQTPRNKESWTRQAALPLPLPFPLPCCTAQIPPLLPLPWHVT